MNTFLTATALQMIVAKLEAQGADTKQFCYDPATGQRQVLGEGHASRSATLLSNGLIYDVSLESFRNCCRDLR